MKPRILPKASNGCPYLILAPMEGVGDKPFRKAMASVGGFDEAVTEFLRVPINAHVQSLARPYQATEIAPIPLAAQIMGSDASLMGAMAYEIAVRGAHRIDLNCGCPSNTVTGRGAGSSLLKTPELLHRIASSMVKAVNVPVTVKMRSGYEDTSLFRENLLAAQEAGIAFLTLHPRTKVDGYTPPARWELIAEAKALLKIPVVGNGDIITVGDARRMLKETGCDALMIGRGSVTNPFIFHQIRANFSGTSFVATKEDFSKYLTTYIGALPSEMPMRNKVNKMKQLLSFLFKGSAKLLEMRQTMLTAPASCLDTFLSNSLPLFYSSFGSK